MLFNSYEFLLGFLPLSLGIFYITGTYSRERAIQWLIAISLVFYAWWRPVNVLLISPSILVNYGLARTMLNLGERRPRISNTLLWVGIAFNLTFLGYFKYLNFFEATLNDVLGANMVLTELILPLGISFITFQKIAFLVDVHAGRIRSFGLQDYCLFVLFFPQLIAGPIVHYREMMPQFQMATCQFNGRDFAVGITLFFMGLFKKVVLADAVAPYVTNVFASASGGQSTSFLFAWLGAIGFTLQIYFDFSGYTDMALGLARFFGIKLPVNFNSPLKATNIIDFWLRWHVSLTRFLTAYLYNPLVLALTRRRAAAGKPAFSGRNTTLGAYVTLLALPTVLTMFVSGLWHGAGYQFLLWGLLHGLYLSVNHAWRVLRPRFWQGPSYQRLMMPVGFALTFTAVVAAMVMFRASTVTAGLRIWRGMLGMDGIALPGAVLHRLGGFGDRLMTHGVIASGASGSEFVALAGWTLLLLAIAWLAPNTLQMLSMYEPALGVKPLPDRWVAWRPSSGWAIGMAFVAVCGILSLGRVSAFLYWQF